MGGEVGEGGRGGRGELRRRRNEMERGEQTSPFRHRDREVGVDESLPSRGHGRRFRGVEVVAGGEGGAAGWCVCGRGELLDEQRGLGGRGEFWDGGHGGGCVVGGGVGGWEGGR